MTWLQRYQIRHYFSNSIWIMPVLSIVLALALVPLLQRLDQWLDWDSGINPETVRTVLEMMASSMFTFIVFICSALLIALQLASAQLTPRIIAIVFRVPVTRLSLTVFVFTFTFSQAVLVRINTEVPTLSARLAAYSCIVCLGVFLFLIDHVGKWLRPSGALRAVALLGRDVIEKVYPKRFAEMGTGPICRNGPEGAAHKLDLSPFPQLQEPPVILDRQPLQTVPSLRNGVVLAFDIRGLVSMAERADCIIEMAPQVGDFVAKGDPLFRIYQGGASLAADDLQHSIAVGQERTVEQDPSLAFRIIVDIALKGLSPAINDPTTAVLAIDQIHHLLRNVGGRNLNDERVRDASGRTRLVYRTPAWEDYVRLAVTEIRHFGGSSIQIARRLKAMLENLIQTLPEERAPLMRQELALLKRSVERFFPEPEDRALAAGGDSQGMGGTCGHEPNRDERCETSSP